MIPDKRLQAGDPGSKFFETPRNAGFRFFRDGFIIPAYFGN